ncbi:MAG: 6,7-dimethyl-8-ribityllumazine synthase [Actinobacteria bacterium]|uniref:6,7-dimethyl-8-ribityllumazine synthase n=1 Tax=freshwater metagenome TaxID=449393 RepID=A0A6J7PF65_9ZZZZ|nr:6,7-dimethyl-8-ribityllumazine synthase [Actinomycetota bacterium]MSY82261.1 6,7-dimethyl-8-ribityllumazine synthase [Actinomycetota bacterium]MTA04463.1 6,7-dimethyl-8-ribityllumazine synthase [Actinomycetota bacterium]MTA22060.1 6,7-dimethyl-8-ribityllumazine synthase [Actinomycetota bacterium]
MSGNSPYVKIPLLPLARVAIVTASWHGDICRALVEGAKRALTKAGVAEVKVIEVPGSFEIPLASQMVLKSGFDAVVAVGLVLRGKTPHFDYVCQGVTQGVMEVQLALSKPIGNGVLMCDTIEQARDRCGLKTSNEDKGYDAAVAVLELLALNEKL